MRISKIKKLPMIFTMILALAFSLVGASNVFAYNNPGPNGEYCAIIYQSLHGDAYTSTPSNPITAVRSFDSTNMIGTTGSLPLVLKYSSTCTNYQIISREVDSAGNQIGGNSTIKISPVLPITGDGASMYGPNTQIALPPAEWFTPGKLYEVYAFGSFPSIRGTTNPGSTAYYVIAN
ncbi:hypothetical protein [Desulfitobacterium chlororespirans]|uniref:Uncharacterized protein n=1 Tax=Desulfitobacterium chlororespirans DSM 11544 TaxID=1121395 RepID=A0A1M7UZ84_9FIRM|nr:hypothetical protein [Desulfitobacterium chlororespirans]SHN88245.1 hypothetical protein SAMN02745215_05233 [Desulfitobacterium chlororespirans DSM 11544]